MVARLRLFARLGLCAAAFTAAGVATTPALAHPHVWVTVKSEVLFDKQGKIAAIRHHWTFDDMYSAFVTTGIGVEGKPATPEQLLPVAKVNVESLAEFDYFTAAKDGHGKVEFAKPTDYSMSESDKMLATLNFTLPLATPSSAGKAFSFQVYDPTFFVDFTFDKDDPVTLVGAPKGCSLTNLKPPPLTAAEDQKLSLAAAENFSPDMAFVIRLFLSARSSHVPEIGAVSVAVCDRAPLAGGRRGLDAVSCRQRCGTGPQSVQCRDLRGRWPLYRICRLASRQTGRIRTGG